MNANRRLKSVNSNFPNPKLCEKDLDLCEISRSEFEIRNPFEKWCWISDRFFVRESKSFIKQNELK